MCHIRNHIESGMALFSIQLAWLVASILLIRLMDDRAYGAYILSSCIHQMVNVTIKSVIVT